LQEKASFWDGCRKFILYLDDRGVYREHVLLMNLHVRRESSFNVDKWEIYHYEFCCCNFSAAGNKINIDVY